MATLSSPSSSARLPWPTTPLIGRSDELGRVVALLRKGRRLATLTGTGGVGKTRLAIEAARVVGDDFDGAVIVVWLGTLTAADGVAGEIARAAGWEIHDERTVDEVVQARLGERPTLLLLDNCEQVDGVAAAVDALLAACPDLTVLATSRIALRLDAEHVVDVEPLAVDDALDVLVEAARRNDPAFAATDANRATLARLVTRLDGLPLALHLAAARLHVTSPDELLGLLDQRFVALRGAPSTGSPHHARLTTMIDWSYRLQSTEDQRRFRALGVFPHTFTREAAAELADCDPLDMLDTLQTLVDHHLVRSMERDRSTARFGLLESMREFALFELGERGELERAHRAHAEWVAGLSERFGPAVAAGDPDAWATLLAEIDNIRAATAWARVHDRALILRLGSLWRFWQRAALAGEGITALTEALSDRPPAGTATASAMRGLAYLHDDFGDLADASAWAERAVAAFAALGHEGELARAWVCLAHPERERGNLDRATGLYEDAAATFRRLGWQRDETTALNGLAAVAYRRGDFAAAVAHWGHCLELVRELGDHESEILISTNLGVGRFGSGDLNGALAAYARSIELCEQHAVPTLLITSLLNRVEVLLAAGNPAPARDDLARLDTLVDPADRRMRAVLHCHRGALAEAEGRVGDALGEHAAGLRLALETGRMAEAAEALEYAARIAATIDELELAGRMLAGAARIRRDTGSAPVLTMADELRAIGDRVAASGFEVTLDEAPTPEVALAELAAGAARRAGMRRADPALDAALAGLSELGLTPRESEVARLLAERRTDPEIAAELTIGVRTVASHVSAVLRKLGVKSRREVAARITEGRRR